MRDAFGNKITTAHAETASAVDIYTADWIGYGTRLRTIFAAADADPDCAFVNACAASVHMALEAREGFDAAQPYLERMRRNAQGATDREQLTIASVDAWSRGETQNALAILRALVERFPADIAAAKWCQYHAFNLGDAASMHAIATAILPAHRTTAESFGMLAFAEEQSHRLEQAEEAAMHAVSLRHDEVWAHHALAHIYETQDRTSEGVQVLTAQSPTWAQRSIFVREHNWWHLAQFHLDRDEHARALEIFDKQLWGAWPEFAQEQIGAVSALWRLELAGVDVGPRWTAVVDKIAARGCEHVLPFHDVHFAFALARGGRKGLTEKFLNSLAQRGDKVGKTPWPDVALPAAQAAVAHARGEHKRASMLLLPLLGQLHRLGGSHSQRDVLLRAWIVSALGAGEETAIEAVIARRAPHRANVGSLRRFLAHALRRNPRLLRAA